MPKPASSFIEKLNRAIDNHNSLLCLGLDPDPEKFPAHFPSSLDAEALLAWGKSLIEQTADLVCCYKPNFAFYEQHGPAGLEALRQTIAAVPDQIPVILDAKRGDIGSTAAAYARAAFEVWRADAVTLSPYLGQDSISPFLAYPGQMVFVLAYTSNPSAGQIQEFGRPDRPLFEHVARQAQQWGDRNQVGFVVGATRPQALARLRTLAPHRWLLAPGVGFQGGQLAAALEAGLDAQQSGMIMPVSRSIIYAEQPRQAALTLRYEINQVRRDISPSPPPAPDLDLIVSLYELGCVQFGEFTLASGLQSPIYIDLRRIAASPALLQRVARAYAERLEPLAFDHLAAVPYAALTIGTAVALITSRPLIYPRKEAKAHGTGQTVEGLYAAGDQVAVIEDLVTTGGSTLKAIETLEAAGLVISDVVVLIDRQQGGAAALAQAGYTLHAVFGLSEILAALQQAGRISAEQAASVERYLHEQQPS